MPSSSQRKQRVYRPSCGEVVDAHQSRELIAARSMSRNTLNISVNGFGALTCISPGLFYLGLRSKCRAPFLPSRMHYTIATTA